MSTLSRNPMEEETETPDKFLAVTTSIVPFHYIEINLGRFPKSSSGNKWIIVCLNYLSRYVVTKVFPIAEAEELAKFLLEEILLIYFAYTFTGSPKIFADVKDACILDPDILNYGFVLLNQHFPSDCTLEEEFKPPALRKSVLNLIEDGKKRKDRARPYYKHLKEYNFFDIYM
ncbi:uncharacterized protein NPIL_112421 [Nephila pilipes]|uniref:Uncharacterized protein n=1 Tax=Nephila pilipes TaxID=299642 RepID=A0A8X6MYI2_NEPPI|nr:uncharacterized protein NPIL_112421 [Nephila pilipes]